MSWREQVEYDWFHEAPFYLASLIAYAGLLTLNPAIRWGSGERLADKIVPVEFVAEIPLPPALEASPGPSARAERDAIKIGAIDAPPKPAPNPKPAAALSKINKPGASLKRPRLPPMAKPPARPAVDVLALERAAEAKKIEAQRRQEQALAEQERQDALQKAKAEAAREEAERRAAQKAEHERLAAEANKIEAQRRQVQALAKKERQDALQKAKIEAAREEAERRAAQKAERERLAAEARIAEQRRQEQIRAENERQEVIKKAQAQAAREEAERRAAQEAERLRLAAEAKAVKERKRAELTQELSALSAAERASAGAASASPSAGKASSGSSTRATSPSSGQGEAAAALARQSAARKAGAAAALAESVNPGNAAGDGGDSPLKTGSRGGAAGLEEGGVSWAVDGPVGDRRILARVSPTSPDWIATRNLDLTVTVRFKVLPNGGVDPSAVIQKTSGFPEIDRLALDALRKWRFQPMPANAGAQDDWGRVTFRFTS